MVIGIASRFADDKKDGKEFVYRRLINFLKRKDVYFLLLLSESNEKIFSICDGFILPGGDDLSHNLVNLNKVDCDGVDELTDTLDLKIISYAYKNNIPILGICRGLQSLNVFFGGTLKVCDNHINQINVKASNNCESHFFNQIYEKSFFINSFHHQCINKLSKEFNAIIYSQGEIEAIEGIDMPFIGVQWHPELLKDKYSSLLIDNFYQLVKRNKD